MLGRCFVETAMCRRPARLCRSLAARSNGAPGTSRLYVTRHSSSAEAESSAGCVAAKVSVYVRSVANAVGFDLKDGIIMLMDSLMLVLMDSEAAIAIGNNMGVTKRTAHFIRWQHYLRWCQQHHFVQLVFVPGKRQNWPMPSQSQLT